MRDWSVREAAGAASENRGGPGVCLTFFSPSPYDFNQESLPSDLASPVGRRCLLLLHPDDRAGFYLKS
jgi:hypothetical protein